MENNQRDFMKNRPVAAQANQYKDVYGSQKSSTRATISAVLAVIDLILAVIGIATGNFLMMVVFIPLFAVLMISFIVAKRADRQNAPVEMPDHPDSIFKDHEK
jgi:multisubunit Na+/H+ antiporter MnhG subunit